MWSWNGLALCALLGCGSSALDSTFQGVDADGDGWTANDDCDDQDKMIHPEAEEVPYDGIDQDCVDGDPTDLDADGWPAVEAGGDDCDDQDPLVSPAGDELPYDSVDQDCFDGDLVDVDGDGFPAVEAGGDDCDDGREGVHPGVLDDCGGRDDDCDGVEDEDEDVDGDGVSRCEHDCDDLDPTVLPGAYDVAGDGIDQNCFEGDKGNCGDEVYDESQGTLFWCGFSSGTCSDPNVVGARVSCDGATRVRFWRVPEYATCGGGAATWDGVLTADSGEQADGHFVVPLDGRCGSWSGRIYLPPGFSSSVWCEDATGSAELNNITTFINQCN